MTRSWVGWVVDRFFVKTHGTSQNSRISELNVQTRADDHVSTTAQCLLAHVDAVQASSAHACTLAGRLRIA
eukprot:11217165-Lingulodinium_polyedra.AAC.1